MTPEYEVAKKLKNAGVGLVCSLPCDRVKSLHGLISQEFLHIPLTREEEGVGISAGAALTGIKPAMLIQSSGLGNMINALASLTMFYKLPLLLLISWRGVYKEGIEAQKPMGELAPRLLRTLEIPFEEVKEPGEISKIETVAKKAFKNDETAAVLLSPRVWEKSSFKPPELTKIERNLLKKWFETRAEIAVHTRYDVLRGIRKELEGKAVVCNLGIPSKELYNVLHQPSNFYMLGSMGMATPIGLGLAIGTKKEVIVIDGDGSLLMNPGILATVAELGPENLTVLAMDNAAHGSTGNQPTATEKNANLAFVAVGMGIENVHVAKNSEEVLNRMRNGKGPRFIQIVLKPGNVDVDNIPLSALEIKNSIKAFLQKNRD